MVTRPPGRDEETEIGSRVLRDLRTMMMIIIIIITVT